MEPERRPDLRASDVDRERVLARLRDAHAEGRLDQDDFYERLDAVYQARTYGELDVVTRDLPPVTTRPTTPPRPAPRPAPAPVPARASKSERALRAMWLTWLTVVLINVVIWASVSAGTGELHYFWPIWVAGPWGGVLLALTVVSYITRRPDDRPG
jgi:hypothetical protein